jgi:hypothetical protein
MAIEVITREDLNEFRTLLSDLSAMLNSKQEQTKQWQSSMKSVSIKHFSRYLCKISVSMERYHILKWEVYCITQRI